jgi:molecular chaperone IbpA
LEDVVMSDFDFSPLFRSTIGFDRLMRLADAATRVDATSLSYPPYNIEATGDNAYRLTMAVAGFSDDELDVTVKESDLTVAGKAKAEDDKSRYLHRGIARRAFERHFQLADHIKVVGASLVNGMLHIDLVRDVPEAAKPRKVAINGGPDVTTIEQKAAA